MPRLNSPYLAYPQHPIREALKAVCGDAEPPSFVQGYLLQDLTDAQNMELQDWCADNCVPHWATGIGAMEAAERIVKEAVDNANIPAEGEWCHQSRMGRHEVYLAEEGRVCWACGFRWAKSLADPTGP